ncbi:MAG TPA: beta-propeller fold lactonase family protein, partial [Solirubrobacteraceae bacterium]|nr:beta-propeller fold lactonase family protein [Solirubrobacteraceae bacterium]
DYPEPTSIAFSPSGGLLATANNGADNVSVFSINQTTGGLTPVSGSPFAAGLATSSLAFDPGGDLLAVSNAGNKNVQVFSVNEASGALSQVSGSPFATQGDPESVAFSPSGGLLGIANHGSNNVSVFSVNQTTGALMQVSGSPFATGSLTLPTAVAFSPVLLATANEPANDVSVFSTSAINPPSASISSPANNETFILNEFVGSRFSCTEATGGPGLQSCTDSFGQSSPGQVFTFFTGPAFSYSVNAISQDGQFDTATINYAVVKPPQLGRAPTVTNVSPNSGPAAGGTLVTITGTSFTGVTAVEFGSTAAGFIYNSPTSITAVSPPGTAHTSVEVIVTTAGGGISGITPKDSFTYRLK